MNDNKTIDLLRAAIEFISEPAKSALKSNLIVESERKALVQALARFEGAISLPSECVSDDDKPDLARAIVGAFEIGSKTTASESAAAHTRREQAAEMRQTKAAMRAKKPEELALQLAIEQSVSSDTPLGQPWKIADAIRESVNNQMMAQGFSEVSVDAIYRKLKKLPKNNRAL